MTQLVDILCNLVKEKAEVTLRLVSTPEVCICGKLSNFDLNARTYTVVSGPKVFILNMADVSFLEAGA